MKQPRFKAGDMVTYKYKKDLTGGYMFGGICLGGYIGTIKCYRQYMERHGCYEISVTTGSGTYAMLESEFLEYDKPAELGINYDIY